MAREKQHKDKGSLVPRPSSEMPFSLLPQRQRAWEHGWDKGGIAHSDTCFNTYTYQCWHASGRHPNHLLGVLLKASMDLREIASRSASRISLKNHLKHSQPNIWHVDLHFGQAVAKLSATSMVESRAWKTRKSSQGNSSQRKTQITATTSHVI